MTHQNRSNDTILAAPGTLASVTGARRHTLDAIFRHPAAHNLEWSDVTGLIGEIGEIREKANGEFAFEVSGKHHLMRKPHSKDLTSADVIALRHFLIETGFSPEPPPGAIAEPGPAAASLLIVVDHHGTKIFHFEVSSHDVSEHTIRPYDPDLFFHHQAHNDPPRESGQRAPDEVAYYEAIAKAVALGGPIVVAGHGTGHSNAARHLIAYLQSHHHDIYQRVVREIEADLSACTVPQLLDLARGALHGEAGAPNHGRDVK